MISGCFLIIKVRVKFGESYNASIGNPSTSAHKECIVLVYVENRQSRVTGVERICELCLYVWCMR